MNAGTSQIGGDGATDARRVLRMIADDLTGALDTAAKFATATSPIRVTWSGPASSPPPAASVYDTGCRELSGKDAADRFARALPLLDPAPDAISFLKLDSLLRGNAGAEIAACARRRPHRAIIVAPALPEQHRVTRGGRQFVVRADRSEITGENIAATLAAAGLTVALRSPGDPPETGVSIVDAETDDDLDRIVDAYRATAPLWCGSSGLANALSRRTGRSGTRRVGPIETPVLGIFGSNHDVLVDQLAAVRSCVIAIGNVETTFAEIESRLMHRGIACLTFLHPDGTSRTQARATIEQRARQLLDRVAKPATLVVSGGETLRSVVGVLGAEAIEVHGEIETGVPTSTLRGGRWDGVRVVSKSGAFGPPDLFARLLGSLQSQHEERMT